jgi:UDP-N-acetylglucosamine diphosphorylase / glucose-1-phosphate thymidylyltransferase / UDP-N-acetylgalactosamine diphosphorylase / glucosamine-1-phosphate N-acetyltransferase / galactosamine-1-phosphate N-acetyltransferase
VTRDLRAVVMAAGEGRRLRPLTERWPKPLLPIDGRPVLATLLRELALAGIQDVTVVVGHLGEQVEALIGQGAAWELQIRIVNQPEPLGSADAVRRALEAGVAPGLLVTAADTLFSTGDLGRAAGTWLGSGADAGLGVRRGGGAERTPVRVEDGAVVALGGERATELTAAPLWFVGEPIVASLRELPGPPYELVAAFRAALARNTRIVALELGPTHDLTHPEDVVTENFPYLCH